MNALLQDVRYGLRMLRKTPGFTIVAVVALMLGIASSTVIFSVVDGVLLRPLPYPNSERIVTVAQTTRSTGISRHAAAPANYLDWAAQNRVFSDIATSRGGQSNLAESDRPERLRSSIASASLFRVFGVAPLLGRTLLPSDERPGNANVVVLKQQLWERRFGADRSIIGRSIQLDGEPHTVVGVMPAGFSPDNFAELWIASPWSVPRHPLRPTEDPRTARNSNYLDVWARLKPGVTLQQARADLNAIMLRLEKEYPNDLMDEGAEVVPIHEGLVSGIRPLLFILLGAVTCLLLIGCANVANLQLARAAGRAREVSIRAALGASRTRLVRQLLTESLLLALLGGALGVMLAAWAIPVLLALSPADIRGFTEISLNRAVLGFSFGLSILTGTLFGLFPAFSVSSANPNESLGEGERGSTASCSRPRSILIAAEVGLSLVLLIGAGLMLKSFSKLTHVDPGFNSDHLLTFDLSPSFIDEERQVIFYQQAIERLRALPGVQKIAAISRLPFSGGNSGRSFGVPGSDTSHDADIRVASPEYFSTMGIPLLKGRVFNEHDRKGALPVIVINEALAADVFPGQDPIGKYVEKFGPKSETLQIVGVVGNVRSLSLGTAPRAEIYQPLGQAGWSSMFFAVRSASANPLTLVPMTQNAIWNIDRNVALGNVRSMHDALAHSVVKQKFAMVLLGIFAGLALLLASIGLYGVMSYSVSQRTREIGIRMAVGAQRSDVLKLVVRQGMILTALGVAVGLAASFGLTRLMSTMLYGVSATDAITFLGVSALLAAVALLACWVPARRASGVDPVVALRAE